MVKQKNNNYGIASLILGISSIVFCWIPFLGLVAGILGIIFYVQQKKYSKNEIATGGLVTGIIGVVFSFIWLLFGLFIISLF